MNSILFKLPRGQRFLIENSIGDRAVFSGIAKAEPLAAAIDALMRDEVAYLSWNAHFGNPPAE